MPKTDSQLEKTMAASLKAYASASKKWFDYLIDDVVVFSVQGVAPFKGKNAYREHFEPILTSTKRKVTALHQSVQLMGERAVVSQTLQITQSQIVLNVRQSVIWNQTDAGWRIAHLHSTLLGSPAPTSQPKTAVAVQVLNEKIATIAAVCGVAQ